MFKIFIYFVGYSGVLCSVCDTGYGTVAGECVQCPKNNAANIFLLFLTTIIIILLVGFYVKRQLKEDARNTVVASMAKQFIHYLQLISIFGGFISYI